MKIEVRRPTEAERKTAAAWPVWTKEASTFPWHYDDRETCLILEGEVLIQAGEDTVSLRDGDLVVFPQGLDCTWDIKKAVRKRYFFG